MSTYPKRLIEVDLPIARISAHARREKSIRHGHISTLHIWWARRPLAACRAVICAALWPDPADPLCPQAFRDKAAEVITAFAKKAATTKKLMETCSQESLARWEAITKTGIPLDPADEAHQNVLRFALLDFIADFANWDNSTVPDYLEASRELTQAAHEALGGEPGTRPMVVDPFAGGGSIPLEALRVGADAFASDLNPVAVLLNKVVLEYIPKYGQRLADEIRKWGQWVKEEAEKELAGFYPKDSDGAQPIAYLWSRTILSESPGEKIPVEVPLIRSLWLCKKGKRKIALRWVRDKTGDVTTDVREWTYADGTTRTIRRPLLEVFSPETDTEVEKGPVSSGSATCPVTGFTTPVKTVRTQLRSRRGGTSDARLFCVVTTRAGEAGRFYRIPTERDQKAAQDAQSELLRRERQHNGDIALVPTEAFTGIEPRRIPLPQYGIDGFRDCFLPRQLLTLTTLCRLIQNIEFDDHESKIALQTCLALAVDRQVDYLTSLTVWASSGEFIAHTFGRQALPMVWEWAECQPLADGSGNWQGSFSWIERVIEQLARGVVNTGQVHRASATSQHLPDDFADAVVTDPPYYYSIPYAELSDFFYVWLRRNLGQVHPQLFVDDLTPKADEVIQNLPHSEVAHLQKNREFYETQMRVALADSRRVAKPDAVAIVVFAHTDTDAWESLLGALIGAGWMVTGSWPIDTERASRVLASRQSTLASSVHLVCRPRENADGSLREETGEWREVLAELPCRIHEWMPRLAQEGVVGADAIFACLGPALDIFSRYSRVEKASGEEATLREYLEHVWAAVSTEALRMIFDEADAAGLEPDARLTAMWLWTLGAGTGKAGGNGSGETVIPGLASEDDEDEGSAESPHPGPLPEGEGARSTGYTLEFDAARKIAQGLGVHLEKVESVVEIKGDKARLLPVAERTKYLFGKDSTAPAATRRKKKSKQMSLFAELDEVEAAEGGATGELAGASPGSTALDRVHQAMILFGAGRGEAMKRFLVEEGVGADARFWKLAQSLSALYPRGTDEKRWVDGVLARKKGLGL